MTSGHVGPHLSSVHPPIIMLPIPCGVTHGGHLHLDPVVYFIGKPVPRRKRPNTHDDDGRYEHGARFNNS